MAGKKLLGLLLISWAAQYTQYSHTLQELASDFFVILELLWGMVSDVTTTTIRDYTCYISCGVPT